MTTVIADHTGSPEVLRAAMVDWIVANRAEIAGLPVLSGRVLAVMRTVPRHRFVPDADLEHAYAEDAVITKRSADGTALSCASAPSVVAMMLDQLDVRAGQRVLEVGAGTGYNAALLAELVGPGGQVTTIDIDPEVTAAARRNLEAAGYSQVRVVCGDGARGYEAGAAYDAIIVAVGPWDLPATWRRQLRDGGRLVVPLRWRGTSRSVAFVRHGEYLVAEAVEICGFVPMRGPGQDGERVVAIHAGNLVSVAVDADQDIDPGVLDGVVEMPRQECWSGVVVGPNTAYDGVWLRMMATEPGTCALAIERAAVEAGLCLPAMGWRTPPWPTPAGAVVRWPTSPYGRPPARTAGGSWVPSAMARTAPGWPTGCAGTSAPGTPTGRGHRQSSPDL